MTYLIECSKTGVCKIGKSNTPLKRFDSIKTGNPFVVLIGVSELNESELHEKYSEFRFSGEWFDFPKNIKEEVYSKFKPFENVKNEFVNDEFIKKIKILDENFDIVSVNKFTDLVYNKLGKGAYIELLRNCQEFNDLVSKSAYLSL
jgi:hypothetical protein